MMMKKPMKTCFATLLFSALCSTGTSAAGVSGASADGTATDGIVYRDKHVRMTVVTDGIVRLEYSPKGRFVDDPSFVAFNRTYPATGATVSDDGQTVTVATRKMTASYRKSKGAFSPDNLTITSAQGVKPFEWHPGMEQQHNLLGTVRTLDQWDGPDLMEKGDDGKRHPTPQTLDKGLLARDGWTLIDDTDNFLLDSDSELPWVKEPAKEKGHQDWYFMAYGDDYKGALQDFTVLSGKVSLPPRYAFGFWWSRWWAYSEHEFRELIGNFRNYQIPLEVLVVDMDWHYTDEAHGGWTGWTWNRRLFPEPQRFLNYLRDNDLKITLNLHPASGVKKFEAAYPAIAADCGINPKSGATVPWVSSDRRFVYSVFEHILNPMTRDGVSFWWLDWQQEPFDAKIDSLSNTWWLNYTFFNKMRIDNPDVRPMIYHRWGGLGNHRYQIGFSGDNYATWKSLDFLPYFTATAANVCYGFWCHDLGGHYMMPGDSVYNSELYVRSLQFGAYSPMMRVHSNKKAELVKEPWNHDRRTLAYLRDAVQQRYRMAPYVYTMARKSHDTGLSICRPMYYDYPEVEATYTTPHQYMFGDNMLVAPITAPGVDGYASIDVWLPEGQWYEQATGTLLEGGRTLTRRFTLSETPVYIKAGSILPYHANRETTLRHCDAPIELTVYPGGDGDFVLYEDYGDDNRYADEYATTAVSSRREGNRLTVGIAPRQGAYREMPESRKFSVSVVATKTPLRVLVDGEESAWEYRPEDLAVVVSLPEQPCSQARSVELIFPDEATMADGVIGSMHRFVDTFGELKNRYARLQVTEDFGPMSVIYEALMYAPERAEELVEQFRSNFARIDEVVAEQPMSDSAREWFLKGIGVK